MADLHFTYLRQNKMAAYRGTVPVGFLSDATANLVSATVADCTTSKQTSVAPDIDGDGAVLVRVVARGGDLFIRAGANPTAVANAAQNVALAQNAVEYFTIRAGERIAAINA